MKLFFTFLTILTLSACSSNHPNLFGMATSSPYKSFGDFVDGQQLNKVDKIDSLSFWSITPLDNDYALLSIKNNHHYVLELDESCQGVEYSKRFGVIQREDNQLNINDKLVRLGDKKTQCSITSIYKLHQVQFEELDRLRFSSLGETREGMSNRRI